MMLRVEREGRQAQIHGSQKFEMTTREGKRASETRIKKRKRKMQKNSHQRPSVVIRQINSYLIYKETPSSFFTSHPIKATPHFVRKYPEDLFQR